jgi:hypothetical protein
MPFTRLAKPILRGGGQEDFVALALEVVVEDLPDVCLVLDHQDAGHALSLAAVRDSR